MQKKQSSFGFDVPVKIHSDDPPLIYNVALQAARHGISDASREAYQDLKDSGQLTKQEQIIIRALESKPPMTGREIQNITGIDINAVSGRVNDLKKKRVVVEAQKRVCKITGRMVTTVRVNS